MATGSGTGTIAIDAVATLATIRNRVEATLQDSANAVWSTDDIDEAIRKALDRLNWVLPREVIGAITLAAAGREISLASLTGLLDVKRVWWDYDSTSPTHPPDFRRFQVWPNNILYIDDDDEPAAGDVVRVWYTKHHTILNLDSGTETTLDSNWQGVIVTGAAGYAAQSRAVELAEQATLDGSQSRLMDFANKMIAEFRTQVRAEANIESNRQARRVPTPMLDRFDLGDDGW